MSSQTKVVITRHLGPDVMPILEARKDLQLVVWPEDRAADRQWVLENLKGAAGALVMLTDKVNAEFLNAAGSSLRVVSTMSVGYEHADLAELASRNVKLGFTPDVLTDAVADLSVMLAFMASRNIGEVFSLVKSGNWPKTVWSPFALCGPQLSLPPVLASSSNPSPAAPQRTVGFLGFGRIAQATLTRLIPFGFTRCLYSSNPNSPPQLERDAHLLSTFRGNSPTTGLYSLKKVNLDALAKDSDVIFVLAPGGADTRHVVDEDFLKKMKKTAVLVNTARGTLVDSDALAKALREGWIWGAGVDVVEGEPSVTADHPLVKEPRCVVIPHVGSATFETRRGMATLAVNNLLAGIDDTQMPAELSLKSRL